MTEGVIWKQLLLFSIPLILGDLFQQLYNTVDSVIVGRFVGKEALAAVTSSETIINIVVGVFSGVGTGATIVTARYFGAKDDDGLRRSIHTTVAFTLLLGAALTVLSTLAAPLLLRLQATPADVYPHALTYLRIYFLGISGLIVYNMLSGLLRAVGDSRRPLICLVICAVLNMGLDLLLVIVFGMGVAGAAIATIAAQFVSAFVLLGMMLRTGGAHRLEPRRLSIDRTILGRLLGVGIPIGVQKSLIALSNTLVLSRINYFGSSATAAWGVYRKLDTLINHIVQNMGLAVSTFISQNLGAGHTGRIRRGSATALALSMSMCVTLQALMLVFRRQLIALFNTDAEVLSYGSLIFLTSLPLQFFTAIGQHEAGVVRGYGNSRAPMLIYILCYIVIRQLYLNVLWVFFKTLPVAVSCYPFAWAVCAAMMYLYRKRFVAKTEQAA